MHVNTRVLNRLAYLRARCIIKIMLVGCRINVLTERVKNLRR